MACELKQLVDSINEINATEGLGTNSPIKHAKQTLRATLVMAKFTKAWWRKTSATEVGEEDEEHLPTEGMPPSMLSIKKISKDVSEAMEEYVDIVVKSPSRKEGSDLFSLACETGYSGSIPRKWFPTKLRWHVWVSPKDSVQTMYAKLLSVCLQSVAMQCLLVCPSPAVRLIQRMQALDPSKNLEENGITPALSSDSIMA